MKWIILVVLLLISWVGGRWTVKKYETNIRKLKQLERWNLISLVLVMLGCYLLIKFTEQTFSYDYYYLIIFLFTTRLSLAVHRLLSTRIDEELPKKEKDSRLVGSLILILSLGLMLIWLLVGFASPGSLGTMPVPAQ
jgi:hypothetical protein